MCEHIDALFREGWTGIQATPRFAALPESFVTRTEAGITWSKEGMLFRGVVRWTRRWEVRLTAWVNVEAAATARHVLEELPASSYEWGMERFDDEKYHVNIRVGKVAKFLEERLRDAGTKGRW